MVLSKKKLSFNWEDAPDNKGIYIFLNFENEIIYIGSSYELRERIRGYVTRYYSMIRNPCFFEKSSLINIRLDEVEKVSYLEFDDPWGESNYCKFRTVEKKLIVTHKPKYCGEYSTIIKDEKYKKELQIAIKEIDEYKKYYQKAQKAFNDIMQSRFKNEGRSSFD